MVKYSHMRKQLERFIADETGIASGVVAKEEVAFLKEENWDNVTDHCLMEAARACLFADILGFDPALKKDLALAALLHDGHKRREVEAIRSAIRNGSSGREASNRA